VIDYAPFHRSEEFEEKIAEWEKPVLRVYFLPPYCSSLNTPGNIAGKDKVSMDLLGSLSIV